MEIAIQVVWWVGLIGAVLLTLVILKEVALVLRTLANIYQLAKIIRTAAQGLARNAEGIATLAFLADSAERVREATARYPAVAASIEHRLETVHRS